MEDRVLFVTVAPTPRAEIIPWPLTQVTVDGEAFEDAGYGDTNGFYDYLRRPDGRIVGVRFQPFFDSSSVLISAVQGPGLRVTGRDPCLEAELFWRNIQPYSDALSGDQFMDYNYIFKGSLGTYGITFGLAHLREYEVSDLLIALP